MSAEQPFPESPYPPAPSPGYGAPPLASWGQRALAIILDGLIFAAIIGIPVGVLSIVLLAGSDGSGAEALLNVLWFSAAFLFALLYYPLTMRRPGAHNGQTWGKQIIGIRVVKQAGEPFDAGAALLRDVLIKGVVMGICFIVQILNYLSPLWDDRNQAWHDKIANTLVVRA